MKVLAFLQQVCCDQDQRIAGHPKLPHESAVDRTEHSPYRLLLAQHLPDLGRHFGELPFPQRWHVGIDDEIEDRKSTRLNSSHSQISYAVFCLKKKKKN